MTKYEKEKRVLHAPSELFLLLVFYLSDMELFRQDYSTGNHI